MIELANQLFWHYCICVNRVTQAMKCHWFWSCVICNHRIHNNKMCRLLTSQAIVFVLFLVVDREQNITKFRSLTPSPSSDLAHWYRSFFFFFLTHHKSIEGEIKENATRYLMLFPKRIFKDLFWKMKNNWLDVNSWYFG